jgi:hypothetical protein
MTIRGINLWKTGLTQNEQDLLTCELEFILRQSSKWILHVTF